MPPRNKAGRPRVQMNSRYTGLGAKEGNSTIDDWDWDSELVGDVVRAVITQGDAIMFGLTGDGGALRVTVLEGDNRIVEYASGTEAIRKLLTNIRDLATD